VALSAATLLPALALVPDHGLEGAAGSFLIGNVVAALVAMVAHRRAVATAAVDPLVPPAHDHLEPEDVVVLAPLT
jgi:hypothetical protein